MPKTKQKASADGIWAVSLVFQILETLSRGEKPWRVTDIAADFGTSKTRVFRYLQTLMKLGYVSQERDTERYRIGMRLVFLGNAAAMSFDLVSLSRPMLHHLRDTLQLAVVLSKVEDEKVFIIDKVDGPSSLSINAMAGIPLSLNSSAQGKLLVAFSDPALLEKLIAAGLKAVTPSSITDAEQFRREIDRVRSQGWATASSESLTGLNVAAVPIFDDSRKVAATIGILGSVDEIAAVPEPRQLSELQATAHEIAQRVYGTSKAPASP